jgi:hypothetical protein
LRQVLPLPAEPFCGRCGQEVRVNSPTLWEFLHHFGGHCIPPYGALTLASLRGQREHLVHPFRLYLSINFVSLFFLQLLTRSDEAAHCEAITRAWWAIVVINGFE